MNNNDYTLQLYLSKYAVKMILMMFNIGKFLLKL